jgi:hypothetical protein
MQHSCIKCTSQYDSDDAEAYLCPMCLDAKQAIAAEIDRKYGSTAGQQPSGELQAFEATSKTIKMANGRTASFAMTKLN